MMENLKTKLSLYKYAVTLLAIGGLNWGLIGLFDFNLLGELNNLLLTNDFILRLLYILIGLSALYLMFNRDYYYPFLGYSKLPPTSIPTHNPTDYDKTVAIETDDPNIIKVVYWASTPDGGSEDSVITSETSATSATSAYGGFENYGVAEFVNGKTMMYIKEPHRYYVKKFGLINKLVEPHVHYRFVYRDGLLSPVKTYYLYK